MFTGIISAVGEVLRVSGIESAPLSRSSTEERVFAVRTPYPDTVLGESIAVNGVCLTVTAMPGDGILEFYASRETCSRTNLGALRPGSPVNLERALRFEERLSGHLVQGHVDGSAHLKSVRTVGESHELLIELPRHFLRYVIEKGSITLDGISLTVNTIQDSDISLMIIPHTWQNTALGALLDHRSSGGAAGGRAPAHSFNVELDMIAKYVERLTQFHGN